MTQENYELVKKAAPKILKGEGAQNVGIWSFDLPVEGLSGVYRVYVSGVGLSKGDVADANLSLFSWLSKNPVREISFSRSRIEGENVRISDSSRLILYSLLESLAQRVR